MRHPVRRTYLFRWLPNIFPSLVDVATIGPVILWFDNNFAGPVNKSPFGVDLYISEAFGKSLNFTVAWLYDNLPGLVDESPLVTNLNGSQPFGEFHGIVELERDYRLPGLVEKAPFFVEL